jgi:hypothetical protein
MRSALIISTDTLTNTFDRRILFQADLLIHAGWNVLIFARHNDGRKVRFTHEHGHNFILFPLTRFENLVQIAHATKISGSSRRVLKRLFLYCLAMFTKFRFRSVSNYAFRVLFRIASSLNARVTNDVFRKPLRSIYRKVCGARLVDTHQSHSLGEIDLDGELIFQNEFFGLDYDQCFDDFELDSSIDLVIVCDATAGIAGIKLADRSASQLWFDAHEFYSEIGSLTPDEKSNIQRIESLLLSRASRCYTVNEKIAMLMNAEMNQSKFKVLPNAFNPAYIEVNETPARTVSIRSELGLSASSILFVYHGWFGADRNLKVLIDTFGSLSARNRDIHLALMGYGNLNSTYNSRLPKNVHLMESVDSKAIGDRLQGSDCFVVPYQPTDLNTLLCHPNKVGDAIALRTPLLFSEGLLHLQEITDRFKFGVAAPFTNVEETVDLIMGTDWKKLQANARWNELDEAYGWIAFESRFTSWLKEDFDD